MPPGEWAVETGHCERRETLPPGPSPQDLAHLVLSESMVWKRPSSSFSLRTPSAKKSWNSSKDNFPSSARKGWGESSWCLTDGTSLDPDNSQINRETPAR